MPKLIIVIITRLNEHAKRENQPLHQHLTSCSDFNYLVQLFKMPVINASRDLLDQEQHLIDTAINNITCSYNYVFNV